MLTKANIFFLKKNDVKQVCVDVKVSKWWPVNYSFKYVLLIETSTCWQSNLYSILSMYLWCTDMGGAHLYYVALSDWQEKRASEKETDGVLQSYVLSMAMALVCALTNLYRTHCFTNTDL